MSAEPFPTTGLDLPRTNGELVFEEPWQARAFGMGVAALRALGIPAVEWRDALAEAIARTPSAAGDGAEAYYAAWLEALERVLATRGVTG